MNTEYIFTDPEKPSGVAQITVDKNAENCIVVASGANMTLSEQDVDQAKQLIGESEILLMQLEVPLKSVQYAASIANKAGVKVILNPAPACVLPDELYPDLYMLIPNNTEAELLTGVKVSDWESAKKAATILQSRGVNIVIITLGSLGALILKEGEFIEASIEVKVKAVDTTAAGDTFCGALAVALAEDMDIRQAVRFANRAAGLSVTKVGAQVSVPYRKDVVLP